MADREHRLHTIDPARSELLPLLQRTYDAASFEPHERLYRRPVDGQSWRVSNWALDMRVALSRTELLAPIAREMLAELDLLNVQQVAGRGFGAYPLVGAMTALGDSVRAGYVRGRVKRHGFHSLIEGDLDPGRPVAVVDDLISSGGSAATAIHALSLRGFTVAAVLVVFRYDWRQPERLIDPLGVQIHALGRLMAMHGQPLADREQ